MDPIRQRPHDSHPQRSPWLRAGVVVLVVGALLTAMFAVRDRLAPPAADVRATRSYQTSESTPATDGTDTSVGTDATAQSQPPSSSETSATSPPETTSVDSTEPPWTVPTVQTTETPVPETTHAPTTTPPVSDDSEATLADPNFFVDWLPQLRSMPAPSWVSQGTRLSYYASAASVPMSYHRYVEDEDGAWVDPVTGDHYRQEDIQSAAGHGYNQVSVTALNDAVAVMSIRAFGLTDVDLSSPVTTLTWGGAIGIPGAGSDYWLHPDVLAQIEEVVSSALKIVRMPYVIGDTQFSSIWIQSLGDDGNYTWVYDLDTGVLLHTASSTTGAPITGPVAEGESREGSTFLTQSTLVSIRDTTLPWATSPAPDWIGTVDHLDYTGTISVGVSGSSPIVLDSSLAVDRLSSGAKWARYTFARTIYSEIAPSVTEYMERVDGVGQVGGVWLPPAGLAQLAAGQELDRDPVTQAVVSVTSVEQSEFGPVVTISEVGPAEESEVVYDVQTGLLVSSTSVDRHLGTRGPYAFTAGPCGAAGAATWH